MPTKNKQGILQNNNEMKIFKTKSILFAIATAMVVLSSLPILQSCSKDDESASKVNYNGISISKSNAVKVQGSKYEYLDLPEDFQKVGRFHNEGLDSLYNKIKNKKNVKPDITPNEIKDEMIAATQNYQESNNIFKIKLDERVDINKMHKEAQSIKKGIGDSALIIGELNTVQKDLLVRLNFAIEDEYNSKDLSQLAKKLTQINSEATLKLNREDANEIYLASSVAFASTQYWRENFNKWSSLLKKDGKQKNKRMKLTIAEAQQYFEAYILPVIKADVEGAVLAATVASAKALYVTAATGGTAAPLTFTAFCSAVGGAALLDSGKAIYELVFGPLTFW